MPRGCRVLLAATFVVLVTHWPSLGSSRHDHHDHFQDGVVYRLVNLYRGRGGAPIWKEGRGLVRFRSLKEDTRSRSDLVDIRFLLYFRDNMLS